MDDKGFAGGLKSFLSPPNCGGLAEGMRLRTLQAVAIAVPLAVAPGILASVIDMPKRIALEALVVLAWMLLAAQWGATGAIRMRRTGLNAPLLAMLASAAASSALAVNRTLAFDHTSLLLLYAALAWVVASGLGPASLWRLLTAVLAAGGTVALYGILQYCGIDFLPWASSWGSRCFGTIGNPVFFAEFLAPIFVLAAAMLTAEENEERKDLLGLLVLALFLALLFSQTRSSWLGSIAGVAVAGWSLWAEVPGGRTVVVRNRVWLLSSAAFAVAVSLTISSPKLFGTAALPLGDRVTDMVNWKGWTVRHRLVLWRAGALMLRDAPLLGTGPEHFRTYFPAKQALFRPALTAKGFSFAPKEARAHNDYVQAAAEVGVIGLGILLWVFTSLIRAGLRAVRRASGPGEGALAAGMFGGCVALMVDAFFNFPFAIIPASAVFWTFAGGLAALGGDRDGGWRTAFTSLGEVPRRSRNGLGLALGAAAVCLTAWSAYSRVKADRAVALADAEFGSGKWEMAQTFLDNALRRTPSDAMTRYKMAEALDRGSSYDWSGHTLDRALWQYREAERLGLRDELLYSRLGLLFERKGDIPRAIRAEETALSIFPEDADYMSNLAWWLAVRGERMKDAAEYSRRAVAASPDHPLFLWTRGLILEKLGRKREALPLLEKALGKLDLVANGRAAYQAELSGDIARLRGR